MADFLKSSTSSGASQAERKQQIMQSVRSEIALSNAQELITTTNDKCFAKCILKPSTSLSSSEETCLTRCLDRYMEAFNIVSRTYVSRLSKERLEAQANGTSTLS
ncbi:hypothetical protein FIBSPDRAFT_1040189 [Athelia psychrophila]|uniref:Mitochondrial import inner membrane translocase subunit n=1 Tax=Athelia psychrophila TaxID=1759441 RepID=A0A166QLW1_9AGAM|nr:hypothetical protein FIBSPDRAFT_1040189 [Fibularhizoctonia sp. CBS 109695]